MQTNVIAAEQFAGRQRLPLAQLYADFGLGQQHAVGVVLDGAIVGLAGVAVVAIAVRQNQVAAAIGLHFLSTALGDQHRQATFFSGRARQIGFGNEHPGQFRAVLRQLTGIGHPGAIAQALEAPRNQGVELGQRILLVEQPIHFGDALRRQPEAQPAHQRSHQGSRRQAVDQQPTLTHAGRREHRHLAIEIQTPIGQQDAEEQAQRQNQLQEARQAKAHDQEQHAGVQQPLRRLRQVLDETTTHDDHQQHRADGAQGDQQFTGQVTKDDQTGHSRVVRLRGLRSN